MARGVARPRARTGDDQDGGGAQQRGGCPGIGKDQRHEDCQRQQNHGGHEDAADAIDCAFNGGSRAQRLLNQADDPGQRAVVPGSQGSNCNGAALVQAAGDDDVGGRLGHRRGFSCEQ